MSYKLDILIDKIIMMAASGFYGRWIPYPGNKNNKPGKLIESLTLEERNLLKEATLKDFDVRLEIFKKKK